MLALAKHPWSARYDLSSLKLRPRAPPPRWTRALAAACSRRLGLPPVRQAYGMTELSPGTHVVPLDAGTRPRAPSASCCPAPRCAPGRLDDPPGTLPEVSPASSLIRGPQVMKGYLGRPAETAAMIDPDGWLRTGDVGHVDGDGWLYVVDRVKELIKYKGYQVAPADLEALLLTHPRIADAAVIGVPDEDGNEVPKAFVVRAPDPVEPAAGPLTADEVLAYVAGRVAPYKKVRRVEFIDAVPRAATGKILRRELRSRP